MSIVALPVRFGTDRFGKVVGSKLDTDGNDYPQPGGDKIWQPGQTIKVVSPWADPNAAQYGYKPDALLSGGAQQLYGLAIDGWLFFDQVNAATWLIQPQFGSATTDFDSTLSIDFKILRFGLLNESGDTSYPPTTVTKTLGSWGQSTPDITEYGNCTHAPASADLYLVSAKTDGSVAVIMASVPTTYSAQELPWIHEWPVGFIGATCTAVEGAVPSIALSVLRDRATTLGTRQDYQTTGSLTGGTVCGGGCTYEAGSQTFTQGVTDEILALVYDADNVLVEITASAQIAGSNVCGTPYAELDGMAQDSTGTVRLTWTLANGSDSVSWYYEMSDAMHSYVNCSSGTSAWTTDRTETFNGETVVDEDFFNSTSGMCYLEHTDADTGTFVFQINTACRAPGDLWEDHYTGLAGTPYLSWGFRRYAYAVIGLYAEKDGGANKVRGGCITPTGTIAAGSLGTGNYGAHNARTGEAVAGQAAPVGYV